ncbi:hypothetical protein IW140_005534 [Coemansia sp. RSA 1813]|nr:hypothetical protein EV178_005524 [Coemansia sp. RSA 1646]KAJ1765981.1 hypothetical protein LPJ74_006111 [Coemansia sp. RSA 1843]KAJ2086802.1 hypothetical protein IW138_005429 [Coemansia sp. RSA 986]KAJ2211381.1 hypothetical protein EV179_005518 [Coemansia sp. RSA 487]KAJ2564952.1 hypothetical protein IW140_005534 [Coemansia sp. RSA 1813]
MTQDSVKSLHEAFPEIDAEVINEVVATSGGTVGPDVVNILLGMSDPSYKPEEQDVSRAKELERDAEYARRLAASEVRSGYGRPRQYSAPPAPAANPNAPIQQEHKTSNRTLKIRNMLRIGKRSNSTSAGSNENSRNASSQHSRPAAAEATATLESDFSDAAQSSTSSLSPPSPAYNNNGTSSTSAPPETSAANKSGNILDDRDSVNQRNLLSSYVPLSPSKYKAPPPPPSQQQQQPAAVAVANDAIVDLEHPFDSNPLLLPAQDNNPFAAASRKLTGSEEERDQYTTIPISETNPFHKRA